MLHLADAFEMSKYVQPASVDLVIFDPPYGIGAKKMTHKDKAWSKSDEEWDAFESFDEQYEFYTEIYDLLWMMLKPTGSIVTFGSFHSIYMCGEILQRRLKAKIINSIVWCKENAFFNVSCSSLIESTEHIIWAAKSKDFHFDYEKSKLYNGGKQLRNYWLSPLTPSSERVGHNHQKPLWMYKRLIDIACPEGGLVFDPMVGSGTSCIASEITGRKYICIEKNEKFYEMAKKRLDKHKRKNVDIFANENM